MTSSASTVSSAAAQTADSAAPAAERLSLADRYRRLSRAGKWLLWCGAAMVLYFAAIEPVLTETGRLNERAATIERKLTDAGKLRGELTRLAPDTQRTLAALGAPRGPFKQVSGDAYAGVDALLSRLRAAHELSSDTRSQATLDRDGRPPQQVAASLQWLTGPGGERKLDRYSVEWRFDCTTDQLLATLADLEAAPEIHAVSAIEVRKADQTAIRARGVPTLLSARLTVEFWAIPKEGGAAFESIARPFTASPRPLAAGRVSLDDEGTSTDPAAPMTSSPPELAPENTLVPATGTPPPPASPPAATPPAPTGAGPASPAPATPSGRTP